jgi:hypothetical protein
MAPAAPLKAAMVSKARKNFFILLSFTMPEPHPVRRLCAPRRKRAV